VRGAASWAVVSVVWLVSAVASGAALAWLYKRLHPSLAFYKLWAFWTMLLSAAVALLIGIGHV
jgi:hypothetical protein